MDDETLDMLSGFICGDYDVKYRTGPQLTEFFKRAGLPEIAHDGTSRRRWTLKVLQEMDEAALQKVILRLASPREYGADENLTAQAIERLNQILAMEGARVVLNGVTPVLVESEAHFLEADDAPAPELLAPPDFLKLPLDPGLGQILSTRWDEAQRCVAAGAHTMATIAMGSLLEGMILAVLRNRPAEANQAKSAPRDSDGKVRKFPDWTLSDMIDVAHELGWLDVDVKKFSHSLREFRNLVHPYQQLAMGAHPDDDTAAIAWSVVRAAANDLAKWLGGGA